MERNGTSRAELPGYRIFSNICWTSVCWSGRWPRWPKVRALVGGHSAVAERSNSTGIPAVPTLCGAVETFGSQRERAVYASGGVSSEKILEAWNSRMNIQYPGVGWKNALFALLLIWLRDRLRQTSCPNFHFQSGFALGRWHSWAETAKGSRWSTSSVATCKAATRKCVLRGFLGSKSWNSARSWIPNRQWCQWLGNGLWSMSLRNNFNSLVGMAKSLQSQEGAQKRLSWRERSLREGLAETLSKRSGVKEEVVQREKGRSRVTRRFSTKLW